jgi:hypothetical protein
VSEKKVIKLFCCVANSVEKMHEKPLAGHIYLLQLIIIYSSIINYLLNINLLNLILHLPCSFRRISVLILYIDLVPSLFGRF